LNELTDKIVDNDEQIQITEPSVRKEQLSYDMGDEEENEEMDIDDDVSIRSHISDVIIVQNNVQVNAAPAPEVVAEPEPAGSHRPVIKIQSKQFHRYSPENKKPRVKLFGSKVRFGEKKKNFETGDDETTSLASKGDKSAEDDYDEINDSRPTTAQSYSNEVLFNRNRVKEKVQVDDIDEGLAVFYQGQWQLIRPASTTPTILGFIPKTEAKADRDAIKSRNTVKQPSREFIAKRDRPTTSIAPAEQPQEELPVKGFGESSSVLATNEIESEENDIVESNEDALRQSSRLGATIAIMDDQALYNFDGPINSFVSQGLDQISQSVGELNASSFSSDVNYSAIIRLMTASRRSAGDSQSDTQQYLFRDSRDFIAETSPMFSREINDPFRDISVLSLPQEYYDDIHESVKEVIDMRYTPSDLPNPKRRPLIMSLKSLRELRHADRNKINSREFISTGTGITLGLQRSITNAKIADQEKKYKNIKPGGPDTITTKKLLGTSEIVEDQSKIKHDDVKPASYGNPDFDGGISGHGYNFPKKSYSVTELGSSTSDRAKLNTTVSSNTFKSSNNQQGDTAALLQSTERLKQLIESNNYDNDVAQAYAALLNYPQANSNSYSPDNNAHKHVGHGFNPKSLVSDSDKNNNMATYDSILRLSKSNAQLDKQTIGNENNISHSLKAVVITKKDLLPTTMSTLTNTDTNPNAASRYHTSEVTAEEGKRIPLTKSASNGSGSGHN
jgi:hypothetical protein